MAAASYELRITNYELRITHKEASVAEGKWISDLGPESPLLIAARHTLFVRLQVVRDSLPPVVGHADDDPEYVHQLRVGTRRADAALRIFRCCLPDKTFKAARRRLRSVRRAAGDVRDWDVFLLELQGRLHQAPAKHGPGLDFLIGCGLGQRDQATAELQSIAECQLEDFEAFISETVASLRLANGYDHRTTLLKLARPMLTGLREELEEKASGDLTDYPHLHQVRIAGKRLRYAMEVFGDCFPASFKEELYPRIEEMQEMLGRANDSHVACERLTRLRESLRERWANDWKRWQPGVEGLLRYHQRRLPQERRRFLRWWDNWRRHGSEELLMLLVPVTQH